MTLHDLWRELSDMAEVAGERPEDLARKHKISADALLTAEPQRREIIDEACRQYAATGNWPIAEPTLGILIYTRVDCAARFAHFLAFEGRETLGAHDLDRATALEFLLIDCWRFAGRQKWIVEMAESRWR